VRLCVVISVAVLVVAVGTPSAPERDDLSRLLTTDPGAIIMSVKDTPVDQSLELLADIGHFEIQLTRDVEELAPIDLEYRQVDYEVVLRDVLEGPGLDYTITGDGTLLVFRSSR
jgi:hypothetical protein